MPGQKVKSCLSTKIRQLEDENVQLRARVNELQSHINRLQRKHLVEVTTRTTLLRKQNYQYNEQINRQNELIAGIVRKIHHVFSEYKEEMDSMRRSFEGTGGDPAVTDEIRVYSSVEDGNWV